jgi:hypothetical protein
LTPESIPTSPWEFLAIAAGGCLVLRDEGGNVVEREPVSITDFDRD